jgi:hypothetical protein
VYAHWIQQISEYSHEMYWQWTNHNIEFEQLVQEVSDYSEVHPLSRTEKIRYVKRKLNYFEPQVDVIKARLQKFNPVYFEFTEQFDYYADKFDIFLILECKHFWDSSANKYVEVMRQIQTLSALVFFILVHIPLSRFHSIFCFVTAIVPLALNLKSKYWLYEKTNDFVLLFFKNDKYAKNYV